MIVRLLSFALAICLAGSASGVDGRSRPSTIIGIDRAACDRMKARGVLGKDAPVSCEKLAVVRFSFVDFDGQSHDDGEIMVMAAAAVHVQTIFDALFARRFPLGRARLMDHYSGDDAASMQDNNTSAFNHRSVTDGALPSLHAYGLAIDINPAQNPFIQLQPNGHAVFKPAGSIRYANRRYYRPGKPVRHGMAEDVVELFAANGFPIWGGDWDNPIDFQHFQVERTLARELAALPTNMARARFDEQVRQYRQCRTRLASMPSPLARAKCAEQRLP